MLYEAICRALGLQLRSAAARIALRRLRPRCFLHPRYARALRPCIDSCSAIPARTHSLALAPSPPSYARPAHASHHKPHRYAAPLSVYPPPAPRPPRHCRPSCVLAPADRFPHSFLRYAIRPVPVLLSFALLATRRCAARRRPPSPPQSISPAHATKPNAAHRADMSSAPSPPSPRTTLTALVHAAPTAAPTTTFRDGLSA
ncbi:hypothetical protein HYPSUDRAFT_201423 [Hypholoma sublateritium FD-334 SS-4]|uniref:Uncharacterized protein n=1 Tax=Hypholoma sublateritium (strain FD-334 SS-4) TaxID=945553 RepID=A0A0D2NX83_HYPSF|nr:hypothetical protein HYPSUDRAFT_201423 [Hypholoma sublateritium FD-334 SS-4]